jgi:tripartite-type tricarboxylate transporter receptor subunit TctC
VLVEARPYIDSGKLRVIATTSPKRAPSLPDTPTVTEGLPDYRVGASFWALVTRAGTPAAVMSKLNADARRGMATPEARKRFAIADIETVGSSPAQCDAFLREQVATWGAIVKATGASVN